MLKLIGGKISKASIVAAIGVAVARLVEDNAPGLATALGGEIGITAGVSGALHGLYHFVMEKVRK